MRRCVLCLMFMAIVSATYAQFVNWEYKLNTIADNREFYSDYAFNQTIIGIRNGLYAGVDFDSVHSVNVGFNYMIEYGNELDAIKPDFSFYYKYNAKNVDIYMGIFPHEGLFTYPLVFMADSLDYYKLNVQGGLADLHCKYGYQRIWCDWVGRQTEVIREAFGAGTFGHFEFGPIYFEDYYYMFHHAVTSKKLEDEHIEDNGNYSLHLGVDLSKLDFMDSLSIDGGFVSTSYRMRPDDYHYSKGFLARINAQYKRFELDAVYYNGDAPKSHWGDEIYQCGNYTRINAIWHPFMTKRVNSSVKMCFHLIDGTLGYSQQIYVNAKIGKSKIAVPNLLD